MSRTLLDVSALLATVDPQHVSHGVVRDWWREHEAAGWATCAITENGAVRILSQPGYPSPVRLQTAAGVLDQLIKWRPDHQFWPCDLSLLDQTLFDRSRLHGHRQITDAYLLALAVRNNGRLLTFDRSISLSAVVGAEDRHLVVL